jgi:FtsP/CotA-like multicopper oxidase with cupredoxin domain
MREPVRSKKMADSGPQDVAAATGLLKPKMVRIGAMARPAPLLNRRQLMTGLAAAAISPGLPSTVHAQERRLTLTASALDSPVWALRGPPDDHGSPGFTRGDEVAVEFTNLLPVRAALNWYGIDGAAQAEPLLQRAPVAAGSRETFVVPLRHAGTHMLDLGLLGDGQARSTRPLGFSVREREPVQVDLDRLLLIEQRRLRPDGTAISPGTDPAGTTLSYGALDVSARSNERARLRFINGSHRSVIAIKIENHEVRIMAIDGQPSEPFLARNSALVLPPGGRVDAFVDVTGPPGSSSSILLHDGNEARTVGKLVVRDEAPIRPAPRPAAPPLPSNGLPARLDLKNALRVDLPLGGPPGDWVPPATFAATAAPAFRAKAGRAVVLALTNRAAVATVFHLHGHHFRWLDRLDDGWKPFWLDTLVIEPGQTQRIAFSAEYAGRWLIESVETNWAAPRLVRWYSVE